MIDFDRPMLPIHQAANPPGGQAKCVPTLLLILHKGQYKSITQHLHDLGHVFAYLYTLDDDSEHPMDYETSLLPKVFRYNISAYLRHT